MICLDVSLLGFILFGTFWASYTWMSVSFFRFRNFSAIILSNTFLTLFSLFFWITYNMNISIVDVVQEVP